jgi:hypothetical protein
VRNIFAYKGGGDWTTGRVLQGQAGLFFVSLICFASAAFFAKREHVPTEITGTLNVKNVPSQSVGAPE